MASVSSIGIGSGVLTSDLIDQLVAAEREPTEKRLDLKEAEVTAELSIFGQIQSAITDFRLPSRVLANPDVFRQLTVDSSSGAFNAEASSSASPGTYSLEVSNLAVAQSLSTAEFADPDATALGTGTLSFTINGTTTDIAIDSSNNTLNGIAAAINDEDDLAANASVINTGTGYKLVITSEETGVENTIDIAVTDVGDGNNTDNLGLSQLSYTTGAQNLVQNQEAKNATFSINGISVSRASNTIDDVIEGVTLNLTSTNVGSPASLKIERDDAFITEKVQEFVDSYNALQAIIGENTAFDPDNPAEAGLLLGDSATRSIQNQLRGVYGQKVQGLEGASVGSLAEVGISTDKETGQLIFDSSKLVSALNKDSESVAGVFSDQGRTDDSQIEFVRATDDTKVGSYAIDVTQIATKGTLNGTVALGGTTTIDADNDEISLTIDGVATGTITLSAGDYTAQELIAELETKINGDSNLSAAGKTVSVTVDGSNQIQISSNNYGSNSQVEVNSVDTNTAAELGLSVGTGTAGVDVAGTINGVTAIGSGQFLTAASGDDSEGIRVQVTGGATGSRGSVSYIEGVGEQMVDLINSFLGSNGAITAKNENLNSQLENIANDRIKLNERLDSMQARLARSFTTADILVAQLNSTRDFISKQLDALIPKSDD